MHIIPKIKEFFDKDIKIDAPKSFEIRDDIPEEYLEVFKERWASMSEKFRGPDMPLYFRRVPDHAREWYWLSITQEGVYVYASQQIGIQWALTTLFLVGLRSGGYLPCCEIKDEPAYPYRGFMLDVSRHFFTVEEVKEFIEQCALMKMNQFHWHLSDDQGFRIESKLFPGLNKIGSYREPNHYGGYYTQDEIRDVVKFALDRGVEIVPEIDLPGHTTAMIAAYPGLSCTGENIEVGIRSGVYERVLCAGEKKVDHFLCLLLDEVAELFPSIYFHIGGDEVPKTEWHKCPNCQRRMQELGLDNEEQLQADFSNRMIKHLEKIGKQAICWNDALKAGGLRESAIAQYWDEEDYEYCTAEVNKGRQFILSYTTSFYFNFMNEMIPLKASWAYDGKLRSGAVVPASQMLGFEAPMWAELIEDFPTLCEYAFPRMCAVAERSWLGVSKDAYADWDEFKDRVEDWTAFLDMEGIAHGSIEDVTRSGEEAFERIADYWMHIYVDEGRMTQGYHDITKIRNGIRSMMKDWYKPDEIDRTIEKFDALMKARGYEIV